MRTTYVITEAHSGTSQKEVAKAKRFFNKAEKFAPNYGTINIRFSDVNYDITAEFYNEAGQQVCEPCTIK